MTQEIYTLSEAARLTAILSPTGTGISATSLRARCAKGELGRKVGPHGWIIARNELDALVDRLLHDTRSPLCPAYRKAADEKQEDSNGNL